MKPILDGLIENPIDEKGNGNILEIVTTMSIVTGLLKACSETDEVCKNHILDSTLMMAMSIDAKLNAERQKSSENTDSIKEE